MCVCVYIYCGPACAHGVNVIPPHETARRCTHLLGLPPRRQGAPKLWAANAVSVLHRAQTQPVKRPVPGDRARTCTCACERARAEAQTHALAVEGCKQAAAGLGRRGRECVGVVAEGLRCCAARVNIVCAHTHKRTHAPHPQTRTSTVDL